MKRIPDNTLIHRSNPGKTRNKRANYKAMLLFGFVLISMTFCLYPALSITIINIDDCQEGNLQLPNYLSKLAADLDYTGSAECLKINNENIIIDLNGHNITCKGSGNGIQVGRFGKNAVIANGSIINCNTGIKLNPNSTAIITNVTFLNPKNGVKLMDYVSANITNVTIVNPGDGVQATNCNKVNVSNSVIQGGSNSIKITNCADVYIYNNTLLSATSDAIDIENGYGNISYNRISYLSNNGIKLSLTPRIEIIGNNITGTKVGINLEDTNAYLRNNIINITTDDAIHVNRTNLTSIIYNLIFSPGDEGIQCEYSHDVTLFGNKINDSGGNGISLHHVYYSTVNTNYINASKDSGILVERSNQSTIVSNKVNLSGLGITVNYCEAIKANGNAINASIGDAIYVNSTNHSTIMRNYILASGDEAIQCDSCLNDTFAYNQMLDSEGNGFLVHSAARLNITSNIIRGASQDGMKLEDTLLSFATGNTLFNATGSGMSVTNCTGINITNNDFSQNVLMEGRGGSNGDGMQVLNSSFMNISWNTFTSNDDEAIQAESLYYSSISYNTLSWNGGNGMIISISRWLNLTFNNILSTNNDGCQILNISDSWIAGNLFSNSNGSGLQIALSLRTNISSNIVFNNTEHGIKIRGIANSTVSNNTVKDNGYIVSDCLRDDSAQYETGGCDFDDGINIVDSQLNKITFNFVNNSYDDGLRVRGNSFYNNISWNTLHYNGMRGVNGRGIKLGKFADGEVFDYNNISFNYVTTSKKDGGKVFGRHNLVYNNTFSTNGAWRVSYMKAHPEATNEKDYQGNGLSVDTAEFCRVFNNTMYNNSDQAVEFDHYANSSILEDNNMTVSIEESIDIGDHSNNNTIRHNVFSQGQRGMRIKEGSSNNVIIANVFKDSRDECIRINNDSNGNQLVNNNMTGCGGGQTILDATSLEATVSNYLIYNNSFGQVAWTGNVHDLTMSGDIIFPGTIKISNNLLYLDSSKFGGKINSSANVTFNLSGGTLTNYLVRLVYQDNWPCAECYNFTPLVEPVTSFHVPYFITNYSIGNSTPQVFISFSHSRDDPTVEYYGVGKKVNVTVTGVAGTLPILDFYLAGKLDKGCGRAGMLYDYQAPNSICRVGAAPNIIECNITLSQGFPDSSFDTPLSFFGCMNIGNIWYNSSESFLKISTSCGDGRITAGEACDDANTVAGDGCNSTCGWESINTSWSENPTLPSTVYIAYLNYSNFTDYIGCNISASTSAPASALGGCNSSWKAYIINSTTPGSCTKLNASPTTDQINVSRCGFVESNPLVAGSLGYFSCNVTLNRSMPRLNIKACVNRSDGKGYYESAIEYSLVTYCGNGAVEPMEDCDDGNLQNGDGCNSTCSWESVNTSWSENWQSPTQQYLGVLQYGNVSDIISCNGSARVPGGCSSSWNAYLVNATRQSGNCAWLNSSPTVDQINVSRCGFVESNPLVPGSLGYFSCNVTLNRSMPRLNVTACVKRSEMSPYAESPVEYSNVTYCGDGNVDLGGGEECDDSNNLDGDGCNSNCGWESINTSWSENPARPSGFYINYTKHANFTDNISCNGNAMAVSLGGCNRSWKAYIVNYTGIDSCRRLNASPTTDQVNVSHCGFVESNPLVPGSLGYFSCNVTENRSNPLLNITACVNRSDGKKYYGSKYYESAVEYSNLTYCGNSMLEAGEQCDDGNNLNGDGCNSTCGWESINTSWSENPLSKTNLYLGSSQDMFIGDNISCNGSSAKPNGCNSTWKAYMIRKDMVGGCGLLSPSPTIDHVAVSDCEHVQLGGTGSLGYFNCSLDVSRYEKNIRLAACVNRNDGMPYYESAIEYASVSYCGDGVRDYNAKDRFEQCDDGNNIDFDGCSKDCQWEGVHTSWTELIGLERSPFYIGTQPYDNVTDIISCNNWESNANSPLGVSPGGCRRDWSAYIVNIANVASCAKLNASPTQDQVNVSRCGFIESDALVPGSLGYFSCNVTLNRTFRLPDIMACVNRNDGLGYMQSPYEFGKVTFCGDGTRDNGEECDDGNNADGDSCDKSCRWGTLVTSWSENPLSPSPFYIGNSQYANFSDNISCNSSAVSPGGCNPQWKAYIVNYTGYASCTSLNASPTADQINVSRCGFVESSPSVPGRLGYFSCNVTENRSNPRLNITACVDRGDSKYYESSEEYSSLAYCGDYVLATDEECDDGNNLDGDSCSASCKWEEIHTAWSESSSSPTQFYIGQSLRENKTDTIGCNGNAALGGFGGCNRTWKAYLVNQRGSGDVCSSFGSSPIIDQINVFRCGFIESVPGSETSLGYFECNVTQDRSNPLLNVTACVKRNVWDASSGYAKLITEYSKPITEYSKLSYCGDGKLDAAEGEQCDDKNNIDGDGCAADCMWEGIHTTWSEDDKTPEQFYIASAGYANYTDYISCNGRTDVRGGCNKTWNAYLVNDTGSADLCASLGASPLIDQRNIFRCGFIESVPGDDDSHGYFECNVTQNRSNPRLNVTSCVDRVDKKGYIKGQSEYSNLSFCGDGIVSNSEECDDGNNANGDGCSASCKWEEIHTAWSELSATATNFYIGSSLRENKTDTISCNGNAMPGGIGGCNRIWKAYLVNQRGLGDVCSSLGNSPIIDQVNVFRCGFIESVQGSETSLGYFECNVTQDRINPLLNVTACVKRDELGSYSKPITEYSKLSYCGDGKVDAAEGEQCDDKNNVDGDGCAANCIWEAIRTTWSEDRELPEPFYLASSGYANFTDYISCNGRRDVPAGCNSTWSAYLVNDTGSADLCRSLGASPLVDQRSVFRCGFIESVPGDDDSLGYFECNVTQNRSNPMLNVTACVKRNVWIANGGYAKLITEYSKPITEYSKLSYCGDGIISNSEECDDGNNLDGDSCSASCRWEEIHTAWSESSSSPTQFYIGQSLRENKTDTIGCNGNAIPGRIGGCNRTWKAYLVNQRGSGDVCSSLGSSPIIDQINVFRCGFIESVPGSETSLGYFECNVTQDRSNPLLNVTACVKRDELSGYAKPTTEYSKPITEYSKLSYCGDGILDAGVGEECDDMNSADGDGCSAACMWEGIRTTWSEDYLNTTKFYMKEDSTMVRYDNISCNNTISAPGGCNMSWKAYLIADKVAGSCKGLGSVPIIDDINIFSCAYVPGLSGLLGHFSCSILLDKARPTLNVTACVDRGDGLGYYHSPSEYASIQYCGDGVRSAEEQCDDGNIIDGDGCNSTCSLENIRTSWSENPLAPTKFYLGSMDRIIKQDNISCNSRQNEPGGCSLEYDAYLIRPENFESGDCDGLAIELPTGPVDPLKATKCNYVPQEDGEPGYFKCDITLYASEKDALVMACVDKKDGKGFYSSPNEYAQLLYCGDGNASNGEECDDGNNLDGDGCNSTCSYESIRTAWSEDESKPEGFYLGSSNMINASDTISCNGLVENPGGCNMQWKAYAIKIGASGLSSCDEL